MDNPAAVRGQHVQSNRVALTVVTAIFFMWGFLTCLNDILIPHLKAVFELNFARAMLVQFTFFGAYFLMSLPAGRLVARKGLLRLAQWGAGCLLIGALVVLAGAASTAGLAGIVAGMALAMFGLGILEATLMSLVMSSQSRALGSTAALLGAFQLIISSFATPLSGIMAPLGAAHWALLLVVSGVLVALLVRACIRQAPVELNSLAGH